MIASVFLFRVPSLNAHLFLSLWNIGTRSKFLKISLSCLTVTDLNALLQWRSQEERSGGSNPSSISTTNLSFQFNCRECVQLYSATNHTHFLIFASLFLYSSLNTRHTLSQLTLARFSLLSFTTCIAMLINGSYFSSHPTNHHVPRILSLPGIHTTRNLIHCLPVSNTITSS